LVQPAQDARGKPDSIRGGEYHYGTVVRAGDEVNVVHSAREIVLRHHSVAAVIPDLMVVLRTTADPLVVHAKMVDVPIRVGRLAGDLVRDNGVQYLDSITFEHCARFGVIINVDISLDIIRAAVVVSSMLLQILSSIIDTVPGPPTPVFPRACARCIHATLECFRVAVHGTNRLLTGRLSDRVRMQFVGGLRGMVPSMAPGSIEWSTVMSHGQQIYNTTDRGSDPEIYGGVRRRKLARNITDAIGNVILSRTAKIAVGSSLKRGNKRLDDTP